MNQWAHYITCALIALQFTGLGLMLITGCLAAVFLLRRLWMGLARIASSLFRWMSNRPKGEQATMRIMSE